MKRLQLIGQTEEGILGQRSWRMSHSSQYVFLFNTYLFVTNGSQGNMTGFRNNKIKQNSPLLSVNENKRHALNIDLYSFSIDNQKNLPLKHCTGVQLNRQCFLTLLVVFHVPGDSLPSSSHQSFFQASPLLSTQANRDDIIALLHLLF